MQSEPYIKIPNYIYEPIIIDDTNTGTIFHRIGTGGFTVLSFLQILQENKSSYYIKISDIRNTLGIKKNETIIKYLNSLLRENLISIKGKYYGDKIKSTELLNYKINNDYLNAKQFEPISIELFNNKISLIGINGWAVLCYLTRLHNYSFGDINSEGSIAYQGYSCPTLEQLKNILDLGSRNTINKILEQLETMKLITILKTNEVTSYINASGETKYRRANNKYIVQNKVPNTKYFLSVNNTAYKNIVKQKKE